MTKHEEMIEQFIDYQKQLHEKNQKKIQVGMKVNIFLPLVFLIISFITNGSKLIFLILWIVSLFGIAFYLLYVEFTDFKMQGKMREFGLLDEDAEAESLIGAGITDTIDGLKEIKNLEVFDDIKELKQEIDKGIEKKKETLASKKEFFLEKIGADPLCIEEKSDNDETEKGGNEND